MTFKVHPAGPESTGEILQLLALCAQDSLFFSRSEGDVRRSAWDFALARDGSGRLLGCAALRRRSPGRGEVSSVCVLPDLRGQGVGEALVQALEDRARAEGMGELWLATAVPGYFERLGYRPFSARELPWAVLLLKAVKTLAQPPWRWPVFSGARYVYMRKTLTAAAAL